MTVRSARDERDDLAVYMRQVECHPLLPAGQAEALARVYVQTRDPGIRKQLVAANLRLVVKIAYDYGRSRRDVADLVQEGNLGLLRAVEGYDPNRETKLASFAGWWIRAYMIRYLINNARLVKIGTTAAQRKLFFNLHKAQSRLAVHGVEPTHARIAECLSVPEQDVADMRVRLGSHEQSLEETINPHAAYDNRTFKDRLASGRDLPDAEAEDGEFAGLLHAKLQTFGERLTGRERDLFYGRLLLDDPPTLAEFGKRFGVSRERARQIEEHLRDRIKRYLQKELGDAVRVMVRA